MKIHKTKNKNPVEYLYVALSIDENGNEGICAQYIDEIGNLPFVFGYKETLDNYKSLIKDLSKQSGMKIRICKFKKIEILETIHEVN